jgi:hypothetical protein
LVQQGGRGLNEERKERWEGKNEKKQVIPLDEE